MQKLNIDSKKFIIKKWKAWRNDWPLFAKEVLGVNLDADQIKILRSVQYNAMTSVVSGTARGKDFVAAVAAVCFFYLTPKWNEKGDLIESTKVALTAPTGRQVTNIMIAEVTGLHNKANSKGFSLSGKTLAQGVKGDDPNWFLLGVKADEHKHESWTGFHADHVLFVVTEASGISDSTFNAIEGNLQNDGRLLLAFNANKLTGYAAKSLTSSRFNSFRLNCLNAPNVVNHEKILSGEMQRIPGQIDRPWVDDKINAWCTAIEKQDMDEGQGDFVCQWDGKAYKPNNVFRVKVLGMFPKEGDDMLIPMHWVELANERWEKWNKDSEKGQLSEHNPMTALRLGVDVAAEGADNNAMAYRYDWLITRIDSWTSKGEENNLPYLTGLIANTLKISSNGIALIDTIGVGVGVFQNLKEMKEVETSNQPDIVQERPSGRRVRKISVAGRVFSAKSSYMTDYRDKTYVDERTGLIEMLNARAYMHWTFREWLNPLNNTGAALPPDAELMEEITAVKYSYRGNGKLQIEAKEDIKKRIGRSPGKFDAVLLTFFKNKPVSQPLDASVIEALTR